MIENRSESLLVERYAVDVNEGVESVGKFIEKCALPKYLFD